MHRSSVFVVAAAIVALLTAVACNGDGKSGGTAGPTATEGPENTPIATEGPDGTAITTGSPQATPGANVTPQVTAADADTPAAVTTETPEDGTTSTPSPGEAQPAVMAPDQAGFLARFGDARIAQMSCDYNQDSGIADCGDKGVYEVQDPIQGGGAICWIMLIDDQPVGLNCKTEEPLQAIFYAIPSTPDSPQ